MSIHYPWPVWLGSMLTWLSLVIGALGAEPPIAAIAVVPSGESILAVSQVGLQEFDWPSLKRVRTIAAKAANLHTLAFSPHGKLLAIGGGDPAETGIVQVMMWPSANTILTYAGHDDSVRDLEWLGNSEILSASLDRRVKHWRINGLGASETPSFQELLTLGGHSRSVNALCLLRDRTTLVSTGVDQSLRVWSLETKQVTRSLNQHTKPVHKMALRPTLKGLPMVASASADRTIRFWQPTIGRMVRYIRMPSEPLDITWIDDTHLAAACVDGKVRIVDADNVVIRHTLSAISNGWAYAVAHHPDGTLVVGGSGGQIRRVQTPNN